jgi:hypothetical protein
MKQSAKHANKHSGVKASSRIKEPATKPVKSTKAAIKRAVSATIRKQASASAR